MVKAGRVAAYSRTLESGPQYICWKCRLSAISRSNAASSRRSYTQITHENEPSSPENALPSANKKSSRWSFQGFKFVQHDYTLDPTVSGRDIRTELKKWQSDYEAQEKIKRKEKALEDLKTSRRQSRLTQMVQSYRDDLQEDTDDRYSNIEDATIEEAQRDYFDETIATFEHQTLRPGDLVDFANRCRLAIYVKPGRGIGRNAHAQLFGIDGKMYEVPERTIQFRQPNFVPAEEVLDILPFYPTLHDYDNNLESYIGEIGYIYGGYGTAMIGKMTNFRNKADEVFRDNSPFLDNALKVLADAQIPTKISLDHATRMLLHIPHRGTVRPEQLWAVHRALINTDWGFGTSHRYREKPIWKVFSKRQTSLVNKVEDWWHGYQIAKMNATFHGDGQIISGNTAQTTPWKTRRAEKNIASAYTIFKFIDKTRSVILQRRQVRQYLQEPPILGPLKTSNEDKALFDAPSNDSAAASRTSHEYNEEEKLILKYLLLTVQRDVSRLSAAAAIAGMIIRETDLYSSINDNEYLVYTFLQELGVLSPWENPLMAFMREVIHGYDDRPGNGGPVQGKEESQSIEALDDSMSDLRKDLKDVDVYCIDSQSTTLIDDGISIERVDGDESQLWIHVHVANPTAYLRKGTEIVKNAQKATANLYLENWRYDMLDQTFVKEIGSLGYGRSCLTFSAKVNADGRILERKIVPGRIQSITFITPDTALEVVSESNERSDAEGGQTFTLQVGPEKTQESSFPSRATTAASDLTSKQVKDLKALHRFAKARFIRRHSEIGLPVAWKQPGRVCDVQVYNAPALWPDWSSRRVVDHDPTICLRIHPDQKSAWFGKETDVVAESMLLAGAVAASWCAERGIPGPYRGLAPHRGMPSRKRFFKETILPLIEEGKPVPRILLRDMGVAASADLSIAPLEHDALGLGAYMRVTSPLRRFEDMLVHYQIESALRFEARNSRTSPRNIKDKHLAYSTSEMFDACNELNLKQNMQVRLRSASRKEWILRCLARTIHFGEAELPLQLTAVLKNRLTHGKSPLPSLSFEIVELGVSCEVEDYANHNLDHLKVGDVFEAEILNVSMMQRKVSIRLGKAVRRLPEFLEDDEMQAFRMLSREGRRDVTDQIDQQAHGETSI